MSDCIVCERSLFAGTFVFKHLVGFQEGFWMEIRYKISGERFNLAVSHWMLLMSVESKLEVSCGVTEN